MKTVPLLLFCIFCAISAFAQTGVITRDSQNGSSAAYTANSQGFAQAIEELQAGDLLTIPGGVYQTPNASDLIISVQDVTIRGAGYDSRAAGGGAPTVLTGGNVQIESDNVLLEGLKMNRVFPQNSNCVFSRCAIHYITCPEGEADKIFRECLITGYVGSSTNSPRTVVFSNCIFLDETVGIECTYDHCLFFSSNLQAPGNWWVVSGERNVITHCVFVKSGEKEFTHAENLATNNLFLGEEDLAPGNPNNYFAPNLTLEDVFVDVAELEHASDNDYRLKPDIRAQYPASDATELGIFGGPMPWKEGGAPFAPRVTDNNTSNNAVGGQLQLDVTVEAQQN